MEEMDVGDGSLVHKTNKSYYIYFGRLDHSKNNTITQDIKHAYDLN